MKSTKKSLFITTIAMVVLMVVALSTATFAWYTSSTTATATSAALQAAQSSDANIAVGWTNDATTTTIVFNDAAQEVAPMVPNAALAEDAASITFQSAPIDFESKFGAVTAGTPWTVKNAVVGEDGQPGYIAADSKTSFFVVNNNVNAAATVKMTATFTGDNKDGLLVAVFVNGKLKAVLTERADYKVGPVTTGQASSLLESKADLIVAPTTGFTIDLAKDSGATDNYAEITINAWLDGDWLTQTYAGGAAGFKFDFTAQS